MRGRGIAIFSRVVTLKKVKFFSRRCTPINADKCGRLPFQGLAQQRFYYCLTTNIQTGGTGIQLAKKALRQIDVNAV